MPKKNQRQLQSEPGPVVLAAILSIDTKLQRKEPTPRGQAAAEGAQGQGAVCPRALADEHVHEGDLQPASARGPSFRHGLGRRADDGGDRKHEMGGAHGEDKAGEWIGLLGWRG